jgi:hypothetical protein
MEAVAFLDGKDGDDLRVIQRGHDARFALEASQTVGIVGHFGGKNFESNIALKLGVGSAIHLSHASGADGGGDFVVR